MFPIGISGGYSSQKASKHETQSGEQKGQQTQAQANTYSGDQQGLQARILQFLDQMIAGSAGGALNPQVQAMKTAGAGEINRNYADAGKKLDRTFASRGFGRSGAAGKAALSTELGRQGALASNEAGFGALQLDQNNRLLSEALKAAFQSLGMTGESAYSGNWSSLLDSMTKASGFSIGGKVGV